MPLETPKIDRKVIPKWRESYVSTAIGELASLEIKSPKSVDLEKFFKIKSQWEKNKNLTNAVELVTYAKIYEQLDVVKDAIDFILKNRNKTTSTVSKLVGPKKEEQKLILSQNLKLNHELIYKNIHVLKAELISDPRNSIKYVDLARLYSILGQIDKAKQFMERALSLNSNNRFILRSATRLFVHSEEPDTALHYLNKAQNIKHDPWLLAAEISTNATINQKSKLRKHADILLENKKINSKHLSELNAAIGTEYILKGNKKRAKKYFKSSLDCPTDNSYAQAIWATTKDINLIFNKNFEAKKPPLSFEATALSHFESQSWQPVLDCCISWIDDEPYSSRPAILGSYVSATVLGDYNLAKEFIMLSLESNPDEVMLINNLVVTLINLGQLEDAENELKKILPYDNNKDYKTTINATHGLLYFRRGNPEKGRELYLLGIEHASNTNNMLLALHCMLHLLQEEIIANTKYKDSLYTQLIEKCKDINYVPVKVMLDKVKTKYIESKK